MASCNGSDFWCCPTEEYTNVPIGIFYLSQGIVYLALYIPCLIAMSQEPLVSMPCYKIMLALGYVDILEIIVVCVIEGIQSIFGITYCDHLWFFMWANTADTWLWKCYMPLCILLGINRCVHFYSAAWTEKLFGERRVWYWVSLCCATGTAYYLVCIATGSYFLYHSGLGLQMFVPNAATELYAVLFDVVTAAALGIIYVFMIILLRRKSDIGTSGNGNQKQDRVSKLERKAMLQSFLICLCAGAADYTYLPGMYLTREPTFWRFVHFLTQFAHGSNVIIYLALNKTIRDKVAAMFGINLEKLTSKRSTRKVTEQQRKTEHNEVNVIQVAPAH